jgi:APA family basic amino acid/polyamine antiporter
MDSQARRRELGVFDVACVVIGGIIGVGIFFTPAKVASRAGGPAEMFATWGIGGVLALLGALLFAELSTRVPGHGGTFRYIHAAFGPLPAFLYGWANWLVIQSGALGVVALVLVQNLVLLVGGKGAQIGANAQVALAVAAMLVFTATNLLGLAVGKHVQNALTALKVLAIAGLALTAFFVHGAAAAADPPAAAGSLPARIASAILPALFAIGGWQQGSFLAGAARRPLRDVPLGILIGVAVVIAVYLAINVAYVALLGFDGAAKSSNIGADAATAVFDEAGGRVFAAMVALSAAGIMNTICMAPPFVLYAMAQEGLFPKPFGRLHARFHTPTAGVLGQGLWAVVLLLGVHAWTTAFLPQSGQADPTLRRAGATIDNLGFLCDGVVFVDWLFFTLCGLALLRLRARPGPAPFALPGGGAIAALFALLACAVTVGAFVVQPAPSWTGLALVALGLPVFWLFRSRRGAPSDA